MVRRCGAVERGSGPSRVVGREAAFEENIEVEKMGVEEVIGVFGMVGRRFWE